MTTLRRTFLAALLVAACSTPALAEKDLYDTTVVRTFNFTFHDTNWLQLLQQFYVAQTNILADLEVDGVTYPSVGVRIRGNTSYTALPAGSQKFSLNVEMDFVVRDQKIMGHDSLNLNNSFHGPTFCREVAYNNFVSQFIPNPRANHVTVTLNGQNWGVYVSVEQFDKTMLRRYFADEDGMRIKCANNPNGPGLRYNGSSPAGYTAYEINDDGGLVDPWGALIVVCNSVTNEPMATWPNIDTLFAIDPSIWSVVIENMLTDDDSYVNKGADFVTYRDPIDGRMHLMQTDANETFTQTNWSPILNFTHINRPVLSHVLAVAELRQRYMAHYRHAKASLNWAYFEPILTAHRNLIDAAVQADPKKLYSYQLFLTNFTSSVTMPYPGLAGGTVPGLQQFITSRASFLSSSAELNASGPSITSVQASSSLPDPSDPVWITAAVAPAGSPIAKVELFYRPTVGVYQRVLMFDNGISGDGAAGDGVYGALLPISATSAQRVAYYVAATSANTFLSVTYSPNLAERDPLFVQYALIDSGMRITEWMYQGPGGEFLEITNMSDRAIDLTGWSFDDDSATPGTFMLSGAGVVEPGESVIVTDVQPANFIAAWGLSGVTVLGPNTVAALGRNDQINIFDARGGLIDRLDYGDEAYPGTIRTQNKSGQTCTQSIGQNDIYAWELSAVGDQYGSYAASTGEPGAPGFYDGPDCFACPADFDRSGSVTGMDLAQILAQWTGLVTYAPCPPHISFDLNQDCKIDGMDLAVLLAGWGPCPR